MKARAVISVSLLAGFGLLPAATAQPKALPQTSATYPVAPAPSALPPSFPNSSVEKVTLENAIERALRQNPTAQIAAFEIARADALIRQARAASLPTLTGNATYTHLDSDRVSVTGGTSRIVAEQDQFNANLVLQVPLFAPSRWAQWSRTKSNARVISESSEETRRQLSIAVARSFLAVVSQHRVIEVGERAVEVSRSHDEFAKIRLSGGVGKRLDSVRSSQQLASNIALLERSRIGLVRAMEALGVLLGEERPIDVAVVPSLETATDLTDENRAVERRQDVAVARRKLDVATQVSNDSWLDFMPLLMGQLQPFYQSPPTLNTPKTGWQAQLLLTIPFYDGGARYGAKDERQALEDQSELQLGALLRQCRSEVRIAFQAVRNAERTLEAAQGAAGLAKEAETMAHLAYEAGASTNLEVIDAERRSRDANTDVLIAEDALAQSKLDLLIASGRFPEKK